MQNLEKVLNISEKNLTTYGFACFYYAEELRSQDNYWLREITLSIGGIQEIKPQPFKIPDKLLIELSKKDKIVNHENYKIGENDSPVAAVKLLSERAGWNQTKSDLDHIYKNADRGYLLATYSFKNQKIILGSGLSLPISEDISWIGMILVHPELRRQGIAKSIMHSCMEHARLNQKKSIIGLDATPQGKQVYDSLGFVDSYKLWRSEIATDLKHPSDSNVELRSFDLPEVKKYLLSKNNIERFQITTLLADLPKSKNLLAISDGIVTGFIMSRPGRLKPLIGPIFADSEETAISLLTHVLSHWNSMGFSYVFIDIPEQHIGEGSIFINEESTFNSSKTSQIVIKQLRSFVRMYQLISDKEVEKYLVNSDSESYKQALLKAGESYEKTLAYMEKEKKDIIPNMYAIGGPEMS